MKRSRYAFSSLVICLLMLLLTTGLTSCRSAQPAVTAQRSEQQTRNLQLRDSVVIRDSIFVRMLGDTVWVDRWHDRWQVQRVEKTDTLYKDIEVITQLPPERYVPAFYRWCTGLALALLIAFGAYIALRVYLRRL